MISLEGVVAVQKFFRPKIVILGVFLCFLTMPPMRHKSEVPEYGWMHKSFILSKFNSNPSRKNSSEGLLIRRGTSKCHNLLDISNGTVLP